MKKSILITGGCGFVGRNVVKKLKDKEDLWILDDLSIGIHPSKWLPKEYAQKRTNRNLVEYASKKQRIHFIKGDAMEVFSDEVKKKNLPFFDSIFHFASIVGGRELIDGDPVMVGKDLGIDSLFFYWLTRNNREADKVLYASSSAAYPITLQKNKGQKLKENLISFKDYVGVPDMTYGWSKLTGEFLSKLAHEKYGVSISCVRPFSGYGEDQDFSYPVPAIARRIARRENPMTVWGTGRQGRDFVHIDDCVDAFFVVMKNIKDGSACNIGSGTLTTFLEVIEIFARLEGYSPKIKKLTDKPVGVNSRYCDNKLLRSFGWKQKISKDEGFNRVLTYIKSNKLHV